MRQMLFGTLTLGWLLAALSPLRADDQADARAILDKAIKAAGGLETLAKFPAACMKVKGVFYEDDNKTPFTGEWCVEGSDRAREVTVTEDKDGKSTATKVINGDKGWTKTDDNNTVPLSTDELAAEKDAIYLNEVTMLAPLTDKAFSLTALGEVNIDDRPALGIKVSHKCHRDVKAYFDKKSWLLVKTKRLVKDADSGDDATEEVFFHDYKDVQGVQTPMKMVYKNNGKPLSDLEIVEINYSEKLDDKLFARP